MGCPKIEASYHIKKNLASRFQPFDRLDKSQNHNSKIKKKSNSFTRIACVFYSQSLNRNRGSAANELVGKEALRCLRNNKDKDFLVMVRQRTKEEE